MKASAGHNPFANINTLAEVATGRSGSLFAQACAARADDLKEQLTGARVLIVGGAGSIGSETVKLLAEYKTAALHVTDLSENYLADLVRELRNRPAGIAAENFRTYTLDYGGSAIGHLLSSESAYDFVLSFAAHKHVRGERDGYSLLSMVDTNLLKLARFKDHLAAGRHGRNLFSVSTDKAANPSSLMGASKRAMEDVLFNYAIQRTSRITTARFANVAFSNGSLLQAFLRRLERGEPLAVPEATRRYFVSPQEAGELCLVASTLGEGNTITIPDLDPEAELIDLQSVAERLLHKMGFEPLISRDEAEARELAANVKGCSYPIFLTPLDTGGEKPYEEFVAHGETARDWLPGLRLIDHVPAEGVEAMLAQLSRISLEGGDEARIAERIRIVFRQTVEHFSPRHADRNLDQRL